MKIFDFISPQVYLNTFNKKKHQTSVGGILSILLALIGIGFSTFFCLELYIRSNPKSSFLIEKYESDVGEVNMHVNGLFHYISLFDLKKFRYLEGNNKIFQIEGSLYTPDYSVYVKYYYDNCNIYNYTKEVSGHLLNHAFNSSMCMYSQNINKTIKTIYDKEFQPPLLKYGIRTIAKMPTVYKVSIKRCENSTINNFNCLSNEQIDYYLNNTVLSFHFIDNFFDVTNYTNPVTTYVYGIDDMLTKDSYASNSINLQRVKLNTNKGLIFDDKDEIISFAFEQNEKEVNKKDNLSKKMILSEITFYLQNFVKIYERSYIRLQDVLANIGGFIKMLTMISSIINFPFFKFELLQNSYYVVNNYLENFYEGNKKKSIVCELSRENMIDKNVVTVINLEKVSKGNNKKIDKKKLNLLEFIVSFIRCRRIQLNEDLYKFRNQILNEATIYELYFNYITIEKRLLQISQRQNFEYEKDKPNYEDVKLKIDRVLEI